MKLILISILVFFSACAKNTWTDEQKQGLMLQQRGLVSTYMSNYVGQKLDEKKHNESIKVTKCLVDLYTNKYNSYDDYFNQLPDNHSTHSIDKKKKKVLMENLLECNIKLSGVGYVLMAQEGIQGYDVENMPEELRKQLLYDLKHKEI